LPAFVRIVSFETKGGRFDDRKDSTYYFSTGLGEDFGLFSMILPSISKSREIIETVRQARGVKSAELGLVEDNYEFYGCVYEAVDKKLATLNLVGPRS
jgi:hypothetical protein